jgi:hypothetical protein
MLWLTNIYQKKIHSRNFRIFLCEVPMSNLNKISKMVCKLKQMDKQTQVPHYLFITCPECKKYIKFINTELSYIHHHDMECASDGFPPRQPGFKPGSGHVGFCDGQKWRWGMFSPRTSVCPANLHSICFSTIIFTITWGWHNRPGVARMPIALKKQLIKFPTACLGIVLYCIYLHDPTHACKAEAIGYRTSHTANLL